MAEEAASSSAQWNLRSETRCAIRWAYSSQAVRADPQVLAGSTQMNVMNPPTHSISQQEQEALSATEQEQREAHWRRPATLIVEPAGANRL